MNDLKKILIAYNPKSGRFSYGKLSYILKFLNDKNIKTEALNITEKHIDKEYASRFDAVIVAGGDGSLNYVVNSLVFSDVPIAHLPMGTVNLFAMENKTPFRLDKALNDIINKYKPLKINLGKTGEKYFIEMAGIGFDAFVVKTVEENLNNHNNKKLLKSNNFIKYLTYILNIIKISKKYKFSMISLEILRDEEDKAGENDKNNNNIDKGNNAHNEINACGINNADKINGEEFCSPANKNKYFTNQVIASNIKYYGGPLKIFPDNSPLNNEFRIRLINLDSRFDVILSIIKSIIFYKKYRCNPVHYISASNIYLSSPEPTSNKNIFYQLDGEYSGTLPVTIEKVKNAVTMFMNPDLI